MMLSEMSPSALGKTLLPHLRSQGFPFCRICRKSMKTFSSNENWYEKWGRLGRKTFGAENFRLVFHHSHACIYVFSLCFRPFIKTLRNFVSVFAPRSVSARFLLPHKFSLSAHGAGCLLASESDGFFFSVSLLDSNFQILSRILLMSFMGFCWHTRKYTHKRSSRNSFFTRGF